MKKLFLIPLIIALAGSLVFGACAAPAPAPPAPAPVEVTTWVMQGQWPPGDPQFQIGERVAERITTLSNGRLVVDNFPGDAIVPAGEETDGLITGALDICHTCSGYNLHLFPAAGLFDQVCGGMTSNQMVYWYIAGGGKELMEEAYEPFGVVALGPVVLVPEDWAYTTFPLNTVDDLQKLKMRTAGDGGEILARMGAATVFMPGGELYEAMERGVINAFEYGGASAAWPMGFQEVMDYLYLSLTRAPADGSFLGARKDSYDKLTPDLQQLLKVVAEAEIATYLTEAVTKDAETLEMFEDYGVQVLPLPKEIGDAFLAEAEAFYDEKMVENPGFYTRVVESMRAFGKLMELQGVR